MHILGPKIKIGLKGLWFEGDSYSKRNIYKLLPNQLPPINYDEHIFRPHSLTHAESEKHVDNNGKELEFYFSDPRYFYGPCVVIKLKGNNYKSIDNEGKLFHWKVTKVELQKAIEEINPRKEIKKILLSTEFYPLDENNYHDSSYI